MHRRLITVLLVSSFLATGAYAVNSLSEMNVVVFPDVPTSTFSYNFVFSQSDTCLPALLNISKSITTNAAGRGNATLDLSSMAETPEYLCTYRTGILVDKQSLNSNAFEKGNVTSISNGTEGYVAYYINATVVNNTPLFYDALNSRFGLGTANPLTLLHVIGSAIFSSVNATNFYQNGHAVLDASGIDASNVTSGTFPNARIGTAAVYTTNINTSNVGLNGQVLTQNSTGGMYWKGRSWNYTTADQSTTSATPVNLINGTLYLEQNKKYIIECVLHERTAAVGTGIRIRQNTTGAPTSVRTTYTSQSTATAVETFSLVNTASNNFNLDAGGDVDAEVARLHSFIETSGNPSEWTLEFYSETGGTAVSMYTGTYCEVKELT